MIISFSIFINRSIRDALHTEYKSSSRAKAWRRRATNHQLGTRESTIQDTLDERIGIPYNEICSDMNERSEMNKEPLMEDLQSGIVAPIDERLFPCGLSPIYMRQNRSVKNILSNGNVNLSCNDIFEYTYTEKLSATVTGHGYGKHNSLSNFVSPSYLTKRDSISGNQNCVFTSNICSHEMDDPEGLDYMVREIFQEK